MKDIIRKVKNCLATKEPVRFNSEELGIILASLEMARAVPYLLKSMEKELEELQESATYSKTEENIGAYEAYSDCKDALECLMEFVIDEYE